VRFEPASFLQDQNEPTKETPSRLPRSSGRWCWGPSRLRGSITSEGNSVPHYRNSRPSRLCGSHFPGSQQNNRTAKTPRTQRTNNYSQHRTPKRFLFLIESLPYQEKTKKPPSRPSRPPALPGTGGQAFAVQLPLTV
jgi:hypothetical protein